MAGTGQDSYLGEISRSIELKGNSHNTVITLFDSIFRILPGIKYLYLEQVQVIGAHFPLDLERNTLIRYLLFLPGLFQEGLHICLFYKLHRHGNRNNIHTL